MSIERSTKASRKLDRLLTLSLLELELKARELPKMRGFERLANISNGLVSDMEKQCNDVADRLEAVKKRGTEVINNFKAFADDAEAKADEAEKALRLITNMPDPTNGS